MERNPAAFTDAQRAQVRDVAWKMIENVAKGKYKLDPRETNNFRSILDHAPSTMYMDGGKDFETFKDAEQKWFNVERGIEEKSFGERVSEQAKAAQQQFKEGVVNTAHNIKRVPLPSNSMFLTRPRLWQPRERRSTVCGGCSTTAIKLQ